MRRLCTAVLRIALVVIAAGNDAGGPFVSRQQTHSIADR